MWYARKKKEREKKRESEKKRDIIEGGVLAVRVKYAHTDSMYVVYL